MITIKRRQYTIRFVTTIAIIILAAGVCLIYYNVNQKSYTKINETNITDTTSSGVYAVNGAPTDIPKDLSFKAEPGQTIEFTSREIVINKKANAAVLSWNQSADTGVELQVRTKGDNGWTPWAAVEPEDPGKDNSDQTISTALVLANSIDDVQYKFTLRGSESDPSSTVNLSNSDITTIDSSDGPTEKRLSLGNILPTAGASEAKPQIISREQWGNPEPTWSDWTPEYAKLGRVVLHHTATTESSDSYMDVRAIWYYHSKVNGWGDIGYHYVIDSKGRIFEGRLYNKDYARRNRVEVIGGHALGNNYGTVGISMIGNYQSQTPSIAALDSMSRIAGYKLAPYRLHPYGYGPYGAVTVGHFEVNATACPGQNIINRFEYIKSKATQYYNSYLPLFSFEPMELSRWMKLAKNTQKIDIDTGLPVDIPLDEGRDLKFVDKHYRDGQWYLRTEFDFILDSRKGIPLVDIEDIEPELLEEPVWFELNTDQRKWNPITDFINHSYMFPRGLVAQFKEKVQINNAWYYRTVFDYINGNQQYLSASALVKPAYRPFEEPRYMAVDSTTVNKVNPFSPAANQALGSASHYLFSSKLTLDKTYYRTDDDTLANSEFSIPSDLTQEVQFDNLSTPRWMSLAQETPKLSSYTLKPKTDTFTPEAFPIIKFSQSLTINQTLYYRTQFDFNTGNRLVLPASALKELVFIPMDQPREMTNTADLDIYDPSTEQVVDRLIKNTKQFYDTKIIINGAVYLRSQKDTLENNSRAVLFSKF